MSEFNTYIATEKRPQRLRALQQDSLSSLTQATDRRSVLQFKLDAAIEREQLARSELEAVTNQIDTITIEAQMPVHAALNASVPVLTSKPDVNFDQSGPVDLTPEAMPAFSDTQDLNQTQEQL